MVLGSEGWFKIAANGGLGEVGVGGNLNTLGEVSFFLAR